MIYFIIFFLAAILVAYNLGVRNGRKQGKELGIREAELVILENSMEEGKCIICDRSN
ncbi:hypothetical protein GM661_10070 [Iocasia frigidifontis]|uniref:Uncharacterized protein n=1 Tax=Iocasia fonsfrigidae TaxID=2682810 RepID=A0A8A7KFM3_9FIRM|nr:MULTISPECIES: hypothetical protein [Halanaerobiaceae]QTL98299.1 hypothetical protein GM661_10070 [Iocasia fonsfrigidae]